MLAALLLLSALQISPAAQQKAAPIASAMPMRAIPDEAVRQNQRLAPKLSPSAKSKVESAAASLIVAAKRQPQMSQAQVQSTARASVMAAFPDLAGLDIDGLVFLVMMQATQDEEADLRQAMDEMKQNNAKKQAARAAQNGSSDQMSDMVSMQQLQLQMDMDRRSKLVEVLSNIVKKTSDTSDSVIQNLK